jgi:molybdate transport system substrate-binding protein
MIGKTFESEHSGTKVVFEFGSSGDLATQINQGAPADVFASGALANSILQKNNVTLSPTATPADVKSTLAVVESGDVDAAIVYVTDVKAAGDKVAGVQIPEEQNQKTTYPIAALKGSKHSDLAQQFVNDVTSAQGQNVLKEAGFLPAS